MNLKYRKLIQEADIDIAMNDAKSDSDIGKTNDLDITKEKVKAKIKSQKKHLKMKRNYFSEVFMLLTINALTNHL